MGKRYSEAPERMKLSSGDVVKIAREMLGMTQAELARKTDISPSHISDIEAGRVEIGRRRALLLAEALGIPAPYIMFPRQEDYQIQEVA